MKYIYALITLIGLPCVMATGETPSQHHYEAAQVYICVSGNARRYHCERQCRGLQACTHNIRAVSVSAAEKRGLTPCKVCY